MTPEYSSFLFKSYAFDPATQTAIFTYGFDDALTFTETYTFDFPYVLYDQVALDRGLQTLFFLAGISYYKMFPVQSIAVRMGDIDSAMAQFLSNTYQRGLGEYFYINNLDPKTPIVFPITTAPREPIMCNSKGLLVAIGGGKDSLVSIDMLRTHDLDVATWSLGHKSQLEPLVDRIGLTHYYVERKLDPQISALNASGARNGHVPISAIFAATGTVIAILTGRQDVVMSNEQSANEATLEYRGVAINHQYSKSQQFETDYQALLSSLFGTSVRYYSLLRPYSELRIVELFAQRSLPTYKDVFSSCNRAFTQDSSHMYWCGSCPKCAFIFLALTPFVDRVVIEAVFHGKNVLLDPALETTYRQLLGIEGEKPLDCIGEIRESRAAMQLAKTMYPELSKYDFSIDPSYDFRATYPSEIPSDIKQYLVG